MKDEFDYRKNSDLDKIRETLERCHKFFEKAEKKNISAMPDEDILDMDIMLSKTDVMIEASIGKYKDKLKQVPKRHNNPVIQKMLVNILENKMETLQRYREELTNLKNRFEDFLIDC